MFKVTKEAILLVEATCKGIFRQMYDPDHVAQDIFALIHNEFFAARLGEVILILTTKSTNFKRILILNI